MKGLRYVRATASRVHDARFDEALIESAPDGPIACVWEAPRSLVVPRSYRQFPTFDAVCKQYAQSGWPVTVRQTGGGIVPQGPGILNFSLAYTVPGPPMTHSEPAYRLICDILADALEAIGVMAFPAAVEGSFCDGRYNLAVAGDDGPIKIAGTAQLWRRIPGNATSHVGLVHALLLLSLDTRKMTDLINRFEAALGSGRSYRHEKTISVTDVLASSGERGATAAELELQFSTALRESTYRHMAR